MAQHADHIRARGRRPDTPPPFPAPPFFLLSLSLKKYGHPLAPRSGPVVALFLV